MSSYYDCNLIFYFIWVFSKIFFIFAWLFLIALLLVPDVSTHYKRKFGQAEFRDSHTAQESTIIKSQVTDKPGYIQTWKSGEIISQEG